jgi:hypothetical protein
MLAGDSRSAWDSNVLDDPRVTEFWDGDRVAGRWFDQWLGEIDAVGGIAWDAYYAFGPAATWEAKPIGLLAAGSDIIDNVSGLERRFMPLLRRSN